MTTFIRCHASDCGSFFEKKLGVCPDCGTPIREINAGLMGQRWASALNASAEHAVKHT